MTFVFKYKKILFLNEKNNLYNKKYIFVINDNITQQQYKMIKKSNVKCVQSSLVMNTMCNSISIETTEKYVTFSGKLGYRKIIHMNSLAGISLVKNKVTFSMPNKKTDITMKFLTDNNALELFSILTRCKSS